MGLTDVLFGRKRLKGANLDKLFALSTAQVTLETELGLRPSGVAAVVFKPLSAGEFARAEQDLDELLGVVKQTSGSDVRRRQDSLGYQWIVVRDKRLRGRRHRRPRRRERARRPRLRRAAARR